MPRKARLRVAAIPHHVIQRGNNHSPCFFAEDDYRFYLQCLLYGAGRYGCAIHAYVLMSNHVHLLVSPTEKDGLSLMMRYLGSRYAQYVNRVYGRTGALWEGRFKSSLIDDERYLLTCYRYIELNPVRARIVANPAEYCWSSYLSHTQGQENLVIRDHQLYIKLGTTSLERQLAYRDLFRNQLDSKVLDEIRASINRGLVLGEDSFKDKIEGIVARRVRPAQRGRPRKAARAATAAQ